MSHQEEEKEAAEKRKEAVFFEKKTKTRPSRWTCLSSHHNERSENPKIKKYLNQLVARSAQRSNTEHQSISERAGAGRGAGHTAAGRETMFSVSRLTELDILNL